MAIVHVIIPDHDLDIPLTELVEIIRERLEYGPMDGNNRYFAHLEVTAAIPSQEEHSRHKHKPARPASS